MYVLETAGATLPPVRVAAAIPKTGIYGEDNLRQVLDDLSNGYHLSECLPEVGSSIEIRERLRSGIAILTGADRDAWVETSAFHMQPLETRAVRLGFERGMLQFERTRGVYPKLSESARQIWLLAATGYSNEQIATMRGTTAGTVKVTKSRTFKEINAKTAPHAVRRAYELGALALPDGLEAAS